MNLRLEGLGDEARVTVPYNEELKRLARGTFLPSCVTWRQMADALEAVGEFARKVLAAAPVDLDVRAMRRARDLVIDLSYEWTHRAPWPWQTAPKYCKGAKLYDDAIRAMTAVYQYAAAAAGGAATITKARKELVRDLKDPLNPDAFWGQFYRRHKLVIWLGGGLAAAAVASPYLRPIVRRLP